MRKISVKLMFALSLLTAFCLIPAQAKDKAKKPTTGSIRITSNTPDAPIIVDGIERGRTLPNSEPLLIEMQPGSYDVEVRFSPTKPYRTNVLVEAGKRSCLCLNYNKKTIKLPCPYTVEVAAPSVVNDGDLITFTSDVNYNGPGVLSYAWSVSPSSAKIVRGAGTNTLTVDSTGLGGQSITATLIADDGSGDTRCRQMAQATVPVVKPPDPVRPPTEFDEFPVVAFDDIKARLDLYAVELQNKPDATGYVFVYGGRTSRVGAADKLIERSRAYLVTNRGIPAERLVIANGGYRDVEQYELWLVPQGADLPQPSPTVAPSEVTPASPKAKPRAMPKKRPLPKPVLKKRRAAPVQGS
jgi:hypothetical protein